MVAVGIVYNKWEVEGDLLSAAIEESLGVKPVRVRTQGFAGPNDVVQWIANATEWKDIGILCAGWLLTKVSADLYEVTKKKFVGYFGAKVEEKPTGNLPEIVTSVAIKTQARGGDLILTVRHEVAKEGEEVFRMNSTVYMPMLNDDGGIKAAECIITFALSADAIEKTGGEVPGQITEMQLKDNGDSILAIKPRFTKDDL